MNKPKFSCRGLGVGTLGGGMGRGTDDLSLPKNIKEKFCFYYDFGLRLLQIQPLENCHLLFDHTIKYFLRLFFELDGPI